MIVKQSQKNLIYTESKLNTGLYYTAFYTSTFFLQHLE